jgi:hypothetical protein
MQADLGHRSGSCRGQADAAAHWRPRCRSTCGRPSSGCLTARLHASAVRPRTGVERALSPPMKPPGSTALDWPRAFDPCGTHRGYAVSFRCTAISLPISIELHRYRLRNLFLSPYDCNVPSKKMHQTTVRFGADLWEALERESERLGVSVAQYVREAALARLVYSAGRRGDDEFDLALEIALAEREEPARTPQPEGPLSAAAEVLSPVERAHVEATESSAVWAQARQARRRAKELRGASTEQLRKHRSLRRAAPDRR